MSLPMEESRRQVKLRVPGLVVQELLQSQDPDPRLRPVLQSIRGAAIRKDGSCSIAVNDNDAMAALRYVTHAIEDAATSQAQGDPNADEKVIAARKFQRRLTGESLKLAIMTVADNHLRHMGRIDEPE